MDRKYNYRPDHETLGIRIRRLRKRAYLTQEEIAKKIGVSRSLVAHWETDRPGNVFDHLPKLAEILGIKLDDFLITLPLLHNEAESEEVKYILTIYQQLKVKDRLKVQRFMQRVYMGDQTTDNQ
ncbi:MAG: helix-turn-helix domain-containing protein [Commensalibacter sp.]|nr:helix-turn-helix domain-containing protein [Commensalibacter sp.]